MQLNVQERLILLRELPQAGDITTIKIVHKLRQDLSFSEEEHELYKIEYKDGMIHWDDTNKEIKDIDIKSKAYSIIQDTLKKLDDEKKITEEHLPLYEKFMDEGVEA